MNIEIRLEAAEVREALRDWLLKKQPQLMETNEIEDVYRANDNEDDSEIVLEYLEITLSEKG